MHVPINALFRAGILRSNIAKTMTPAIAILQLLTALKAGYITPTGKVYEMDERGFMAVVNACAACLMILIAILIGEH